MKNSICCNADLCGSFGGLNCTEEKRAKYCGNHTTTLSPTSQASDLLADFLPAPVIGFCQIGGENNVPVYDVNGSIRVCLRHYIGYVLQNGPMPEKLTFEGTCSICGEKKEVRKSDTGNLVCSTCHRDMIAPRQAMMQGRRPIESAPRLNA